MSEKLLAQMMNGVTCGDCVDVMAHLPRGCVDFILTDPPYITRYRDRSGRSVANDDNADWLEPAFRQMHRVLKDHSFCVTAGPAPTCSSPPRARPGSASPGTSSSRSATPRRPTSCRPGTNRPG